MCGLSGVLSFHGERAEQAVMRMNHRLVHRGPDAAGLRVFPDITLGHRRLSIIDLSQAGNQPMSDPEGRFHLVYNGELYNFKQLRTRMAPPFRTATDTEVVLRALAERGADALADFNGMFALALWDQQERELLLARDPLGIKPLYFYRDADRLVFASELRALMASGLIPRRIDPEGVVDFLRTQTVHAPRTIIEGVHMLPPGCSLRARPSGRVTLSRYDSLSEAVSAETVAMTDGEARATVRRLLRQAVERRLVADVPFGAFLSGGIDSSVIVGLMAEVLPGPVQTFSVVFDEPEFSEAPYARAVASRFNTEHHEIRLTERDFLDTLPEALSAMDHPSGDGPNTYVVARATRRAGVTMALSGLGGDEVFAGYEVFRRAHRLHQLRALGYVPRPLRRQVGAALPRMRAGVAGHKMRALMDLPDLTLASYYPITRRLFLDDALGQLLAVRELPPDRVAEIVRAQRAAHLPHISQVSLCEMQTYMQNTLLRDTDQMSMAVALEVRVPFLDRELVAFVLGLPDRLKLGRAPKALLSSALADLLPSKVIHRPKMGFTLPFQTWLQHELRDLCEGRLRRLGQRPEFVPGAVQGLWARFLNGDPLVTWSRIWALVVLGDWLERAGL